MVFCNVEAPPIENVERIVTILILVDGFLQLENANQIMKYSVSHNPYFSRWFSAICASLMQPTLIPAVTILILVDGFLQ